MPSKKVLYISGPMSGKPDFNFPAFDEAADKLRKAGYRVINPADFGANPDESWERCVARDLAILPCADGIAILEGWWDSRGALLETDFAETAGKPILSVEGWIVTQNIDKCVESRQED